jgi:hypothetical protein
MDQYGPVIYGYIELPISLVDASTGGGVIDN